MKNQQNILIIGAGLCGSLLALRLAQRGYSVKIVEKRSDLRKTKIHSGRSINLAFSNRGEKAMKLAGIQDKVDKLLIPMYGRMIHEKNGESKLYPYSGLEEEYISAVPRTKLNQLLLTEAEKMDNVEISFDLKCTSVNLDRTEAKFKNTETGEIIRKSGDIIIGTDGAGSILRKSMFLHPDFLFNYAQIFLNHGYKELYIPPGKNGEFQMEKNALHIWPRGENMIIALPNLDGSFTVTLFLNYKNGEDNFAKLNSFDNLKAYFQKDYPDILKLMPDLEKIFFENPTSTLGTIRCSPWHYKGNTLLMGDAAHAMVPFYGQGMNASFEDVFVFDEILDKDLNSWEEVFETYQKERKADADAIGDLSLDNFQEMKSDTAAPLFQQKRELETALEEEFPEEYSGKYRLVTFQEEIGYAEALRRGRAQDEAMLQLLADGKITTKHSLSEKLKMVNQATEEILMRKTHRLI
ncbi:MAG TPA: NAD(P)/FAD-dependent oxidoreductase [Flavobacteriaceae bacterium]|nr:NAD(P)/FAD-dependent oxidoreductase [Flavobacteriaceae bacterium]